MTGEVPSEAELVSARERRDYGWKLLRLEWLDRHDITAEKQVYAPDHELPDAYEQTRNCRRPGSRPAPPGV